MKVLVVYYSMYGHVLKLAQAVSEGVEQVDGSELMLRRVQDFPDVIEIIKKSQNGTIVLDKQKDIPVCTMEDLKEADAIIFGSPTRYGNMCSQLKKLFDATAPLWLEGAFVGKPAGVFTSTGSMHGGQETTLLSMMIPILHLGMIVVGVPPSVREILHDEAMGGTCYGPTTVAGESNQRTPTEQELTICRALGKRVAETAQKLQAK